MNSYCVRSGAAGAANAQPLPVQLPFTPGRRASRFKIDLARAKASDSKYADLDQSTPNSHLTLRNIEQHWAILSCFISYLRERDAAYGPGGFEPLRACQSVLDSRSRIALLSNIAMSR